jgi:hypothetical protein
LYFWRWPVALDPRLQNTALLTLAAFRIQRRSDRQSDPYAVVWLDAYVDDPTEAGDSPSGIYLPRKAASAEAWYNSPLIAGMRAKLQAPGGEAC